MRRSARALSGAAAVLGSVAAVGSPTAAGADTEEGTVRATGIQCQRDAYCTGHVAAEGYTGTPTIRWQFFVNGSPRTSGTQVADIDGATHLFVTSAPHVGDARQLWRLCAWWDGEPAPELADCPSAHISAK